MAIIEVNVADTPSNSGTKLDCPTHGDVKAFVNANRDAFCPKCCDEAMQRAPVLRLKLVGTETGRMQCKEPNLNSKPRSLEGDLIPSHGSLSFSISSGLKIDE